MSLETAGPGGTHGEVTGDEDTAIPLQIAASLVDADGSETLSTVTIGNVPAGATLSAGTNNGDGTWTLSYAQLAGLTITPALHSDVDFTLTVAVTTTEAENGDTATTTGTYDVTVIAVADTPSLVTHDTTGESNVPIALDVSSALVDADGSESLSIVIGNLPPGGVLSAGTNNGNGTWTLTSAQLAGLSITVPSGTGDFELSVTSTATEAANNDQASVSGTIFVDMNDVTVPPTLSVDPPRGGEDTGIPINITATPGSPGDTITITITGLPPGATLNRGTNNGGGSWTLTPGDLPGLTVTPPTNSDVDFPIVVTVTSNGPGGPATTTASTTVTVDAIADAPILEVDPAVGGEDTAIPLSISTSLVDTDGSETLSITIGNVPPGAVLSAGTNNGDGTWTLTPAQLVGLTVTPGLHSGDDFVLTVTAKTTEAENGDTATTTASINVTVIAIADAPTLATAPAVGGEDTAIPLSISTGLVDADGSETLSVTIGNVPPDAVLSAGTNNGDGTWTLTPAQLVGLTITPGLHSDVNFVLSVTATTTEGENGSSASTTGSIPVTVNAIADTPVLTVSPATGDEDTAIPLSISTALVDADGSETIASILVAGVPAGATLSAGTNLGGGNWSLTVAQLAGLTVSPPHNSDVNFTLTVAVTTVEAENGSLATATATLPVNVVAVADVPLLSTSDASGDEDTPIPLSIASGLTDIDGSESLTITIGNVPAGATLSAGTNNGDGTWTLSGNQLGGLTITPAHNSDVDFTLTVTATSTEAENGDQESVTGTINVNVEAVADPVSIAGGGEGDEDTAIPLNLTIAQGDTDGSEVLSQVKIYGVPDGATLSAGTYVPGAPSSTVVGGNEFRANSYTNAEQSYPTITQMSDGGYLLVWQSLFQDGSGFGVYAQRFDAAGNMVSRDGSTPGADEFGVNTTTFLNQIGPTVATLLSNGGFAVSWISDNLTTGSSEIYAQHFDAAGQPVGAEIFVNTFTSGSQTDPVVAGLAGGGSVYSWTSFGQDGSFNGVFARIYDDAGNAVTGEIQVNVDNTISHQQTPSVAGLSDGSFVVAFESFHFPDGSSFGVVTQRFDAAGNRLGPEVLVNSTTADSQVAPAVASLVGGGYVVVWQSWQQDGSGWGVFGQRYDNMGNAQGGEFQIAETVANNQMSPAISGLTSGGFVVTWQSSDGDDFGVFGRTFDADGVATSGEMLLNIYTADGQSSAVVTGIAGGGFAAAWNSDGQDGSDLGVYGRVFEYPVAPGYWLVDQADVPGLTVTPSLHSDADMVLTVEVTTTEQANGDSETATSSVTVIVHAVADAPTLSTENAEGEVDTAIPLSVSSDLVDADGSETLSIVIGNVPAGAVLSVGTNNGDGTWTLTPGDLAGLAITPPPGSAADFTLTVAAITTEAENGDQAQTLGTIDVHIPDPASPPSINVTNATGDEDTAIPLSIATAPVNMGETIVSVAISGVPSGATLSAGTDNGDGSWTLNPGQLAGLTITPPDDSDEDFTLTVTSSVMNLDGNTASATASVGVTVIAVADVPSLSTSDVTGGPNVAIPLTINTALNDLDGSESLSVVIGGVPAGATLSAGTNLGGGMWSLTGAQVSGLTITVPTGIPALTLGVTSVATESSNGDFEAVTATINVTLTDVNNAPVALDDSYSTGHNVTLTVGGPGVLVNDSDPLDVPPNNLASTIVDTTDFGTVTLNADGSFTYVPNTGFFGTDTFTYQVSDDGGTLFGGDDTGNIATVTIFVEAPVGYVNIPPVAYDATLFGLQDTPISGTATATDADHPVASLVYTLLDGPDVGTLTFNADGTFSFVPPAGWSGVQTFTFTVTDPWGDSDVGEITLDIAQTVIPPDFAPALEGAPAKTPVLAQLTGGGFVIAWSTTDLDAGGSNPGDGSQDCIYFQRYAADGTQLGTATIANVTTFDAQNLPAITEMADGGFLLVWGSAGQDGSGYGLYAQRFDASGQAVTRDGLTLGADEFHVSTNASAGDQYRCRATTLQDGSFVITWDSDDGSSLGMFAQRYTPAGVPVGAPFQVNDFTISSQWQGDVTVLADGGFLVTYSSYFQDYVEVGFPAWADYGVYAQRYDIFGNPVHRDGVTPGQDSFRINTTVGPASTMFIGSDQENAKVTALAGGGFAVAWQSDGNQDGASYGVFVKVFDAAGNEVVPETQVNTTVAGDQWQPAIAQLSDGSLFVVWSANNNQDGDGYGIFGQKLSLDGTLIGEEFQVNSNIPNDQSFPEIQALDNGSFVIAWQTQVGIGNNVEQIAARLFGNNIDGLRDLSGGLGNDVVLGSAKNDNINTGGGADTISGKEGNDLIIGGAANDLMTGGAGSDTFKWNSISEGEYFSLKDQITDFQAGAGGDRLDISAFVTLGGGNINDFVQLTEQSGNTIVRVDVDGLAGGANFQNLVQLDDVTGLNVNDLFSNNNLVVTL